MKDYIFALLQSVIYNMYITSQIVKKGGRRVVLKKRMRQLRHERGMTQKEVAEQLGIGVSTMTMYETGRREPNMETLIKIANFFDVSVDYLLGKTDARNEKEVISRALVDDPELYNFWKELNEREDLQLLFKQTRNMDPKDIRTIIKIIKAIEDEEDELYN